jgi:small conductance mechanosensitive channel
MGGEIMPANVFAQPLENAWRGFLERLPFLVEGLVVMLLFYLLGRVVRYLSQKFIFKMKKSEHAARLLSRLAFYATISCGAVAALAVMGVNPARLATSLGLLGIGLGFALREVIENFLAGLILLMQRPFTVGDQISFGDYEGIVEDVRVRDTVLRLYDGRLVFAPNAQIFKGPVVNNTSSRRRRVDFEVLIKHEEDVPTALDAAVETLREVDGILDEPAPLVVARGLEESGVVLRAYLWVDPVKTSILETKSSAISGVKVALAEML